MDFSRRAALSRKGKLEELRQYWTYADSRETLLMEYIDGQFEELGGEVLDILEHFRRLALEGNLPPREVERLHRKIRRWKEQGYGDAYSMKLYLRDLENRSRIHGNEALLIYLLAAFTGVSIRIMERDRKLLLDISKNTFEKEWNTVGSPSKAGKPPSAEELGRFLLSELPDGTQYQPQMYSYAQYLAQRVADLERMGRQGGSGLSDKAVLDTLYAGKNRLLKRSEPSGGQPVNYHGYLDQVMTAVVGYTVMRVFRESGVQEYRFTATLDAVTTDACRWLNGRRFKVSDMKLGVNVPPITIGHDGRAIPHPCRSIIRAIL